jgi:hypothetical protein
MRRLFGMRIDLIIFSLQKIHKYSSVKNDKTPEEYKADEYNIIFIGTDEDKYMFVDVV